MAHCQDCGGELVVFSEKNPESLAKNGIPLFF